MEYVGVGKRAVAVIIDGIVLFMLGYAIGIATGETTAGGFNLQGGSAFIFFALAIGYYIAMEALSGGTLGKKLLGMKVVRLDGSPIDWQGSIVRNLLRIVDGFFFYLVGAILVWTSDKKQRLGDRVANTVVVQK